ncbi:Ig-like domain-containing protein, partial [Flavobacterium gyeonganense]
MKKILLILLFAVFYTSVNAQCSITTTTNASALACGTAPVSACGGILYIGNGTNAMSLNMNADLDLTCLGAIQFIVRNNATLDFSGGNYDLKLASGSSVIFQSGSNINSGGSCSASDRIYIGGAVVANCNGSGSIPSFTDVIANGGINQAGILSGNQYICTYGTTTTTFSSTSSGGTWSSSNTSIASVNSSTGLVTAAGAGTATITYTRSGASATRNVYVANGPSSNAVVSGSTTLCQATIANYTATAVAGASSYTWSYGGSGATITPAANGLSASISFSSTATSGNLKVTTTNACGSAGGGNEVWITINPIITSAPVATSISGNLQCDYAEPRWNTVSNATGYYLDIATDSGFTNFVAGYNNYFVSGNNGSSPAYNLPAGVLYYRVRAYNNCTTTANSNTVSFQTTAPVGGSVSPAQTICAGNSPTSNLTLSGYTTTNTAIVKWQKASDIGFTSNVSDISETTNVLSIAKIGVLTTSTYFRAVVQNQFGSWCMSNSTPVLITVNNSISAASSTPTVCINTALTPITHTVIGFTGIGTVTGLPSGVSPSLSGNTLTISGTPTVSGTFNYTIPLTGGSCGGTRNATGTITVTAVPPTPGTINQPTNKCASTTGNTFSITSVPGATSYTWSVTGTGWAVTAGGTTASATITIGSGVGTVSVTATNACGTSSASTTGNITPNTAPTITAISSPSALCPGGSLNPSVPAVTNNGSAVTASGWEISTTSGGSTYTALSLPYTVAYADNGKNIRYYATNGCGRTNSNVVAIIVNNVPTVASISSPSALCPGGSLNPSAPAVTNNGSAVTASGWEISTTSGGSTYTALSLPYTVAYADNGKNIRYYATNGCGRTDSNVVAITVNPLPGTPTAIAATDATCSSFLANWNAATNVTGYYLDVSTVNNFSSILPDYNGLDIGLVSSYNVTGLTKKTTYFYRLRAYNSCSTSVSSNYIQIKTLDVPTAVISGTTNVCKNAASPIITFSNSENSPITVTYNINGGSNSTISVGANTTATVSVPTGNPGTFVYNLVSAVYQSVTGCLTSLSGSATVTVNPSPTPTFTTAPQVQTCAGEHMTYTTQSGQSNYIWTVSGVLNTDYRLIARGTSTNYDIVIEWLTAGSKTVTVNYNNSNGCNGASAATYATNVTVIDRGRVNGGAHICKGSPLPTLTLRNDAGNAPYPDSSLVLMWQYSDDLNNATWNDIPGTAGQISYTPTAFPGAFRTYQVILKSGICTKTSIESRINIDAFNAPTLGTTTYPTCSVATGSVVLTGLPSGNWTINQTGTTTATYTNTVANTTSYTVVGLPAGTYTFTVKEGNCTSDASAILNMTQVANIWDGTKWSKTGDATLPTAGDKIVFEGNYTVTSDISGCSCTVNSGNVIVNSGRTLTIKNEVTVNGGTLTFENNASLLQDVNTTVNTNVGPIIYKRNSQPMKNFDFTYWSSPVEGQTLYNLS